MTRVHTIFSSPLISPCWRGRAVVVFRALLVFGAFVAADRRLLAQPGSLRSDTTPQQRPADTALVNGNVVSADGGHPIRGATVRLTSATLGTSRTATTDDKGNFEFKELAVGQFTLSASKPGYLDAFYGQEKPGDGRLGTPLSIAGGQRLEHLALSMPHGGVISGIVMDDVGEPAFLTVVRALRYVWRAGERTLVTAGSAAADDRGVYRIPVLPPGDYIITATPLSELPVDSLRLAAGSFASGRSSGSAFALPFLSGVSNQTVTRAPGSSDIDEATTGYVPVYFPTTTVASAAVAISLGVSEERSGIDLQLQLVPMGQITGTVSGGDQDVIGSVTVTLLDTQGLQGMNTKTTRVDPGGTFSFAGVAPGTYRLSARSAAAVTIRTNAASGQTLMVFGRGVGPSAAGGSRGSGGSAPPPMWATANLVVEGAQPTTVALTLQPGLTMSGKLAFDGASAPPTDLTQVRVVLSSADANDGDSSATGQSDADGHFIVSGMTPGRYRVSLLGIRNWRATSAEVSGRDALDFLLVVKPDEDITNAIITLSDRVSEISGTLQDSLGRPAVDYTLVIFARDERYWAVPSRRILATKPASDGKFSFSNLPAGDYRLSAVKDIEEGQWFDPAFLRQLSGEAMSLALADGEKKTQDIRVAK